MKRRNANRTGKFPEATTFIASRLYLSLLYCTFVLVTIIPGFALVIVFLFVLFRSRSCPAPHRGGRVKQRTVLPQNIAIITS